MWCLNRSLKLTEGLYFILEDRCLFKYGCQATPFSIMFLGKDVGGQGLGEMSFASLTLCGAGHQCLCSAENQQKKPLSCWLVH